MARHLPFFWGYDAFISYSWASSKNYAIELAGQLKNQADLRCFLDSELEAGGNIQRIQRQLRKSKIFVIIVTPEIVNSTYIPDELKFFVSSHKRAIARGDTCIVPINVNGTLYKGLVAEKIASGAEPWNILRDLNRIEENAEAVSCGKPSEYVAQQIKGSFGYTRAKVKWTRILFLVSLCFFALSTMSLLTLFGIQQLKNQAKIELDNYNGDIDRKVKEINQKAAQIERQNETIKEANINLGELGKNISDLKIDRASAIEDKSRALKQADSAKNQASRFRRDASVQKRIAENETRRAEKQTQRADRQSAIANVRSLTNASRYAFATERDSFHALDLSLKAMSKMTDLNLIESETIKAFWTAYCATPTLMTYMQVKGVYLASKLSDDGAEIAVAVRPGAELVTEVVVFDADTHREKCRFKQEGIAPLMALAPKSSSLFLSTSTNTHSGILQKWSTSSAPSSGTPVSTNLPVTALAISKDERFVSWVEGRQDAKICPTSSFSASNAVRADKLSNSIDLDFHDDFNLIGIGRLGFSIYKLNLTDDTWGTAEPTPTLPRGITPSNLIFPGLWAVSKNASHVALRSKEGISVWSQAPDFSWKSQHIDIGKSVRPISLSRSGNYLSAVTFDNNCMLWQLEGSRYELGSTTEFRQEPLSGGIDSAFDDSEKLLGVAGGFTQFATVYQVPTLKPAFFLKDSGTVYRVAVDSQRAQETIVSSIPDKTILSWHSFDPSFYNPGQIQSIVFTRDGAWSACVAKGIKSPDEVIIKKLATGKSFRCSGLGDRLQAIAFDSASKLVAILSVGSLGIYDFVDGKLGDLRATASLDGANVDKLQFIGDTKIVLLSAGPGGDSIPYTYDCNRPDVKPKSLGSGVLYTATTDDGDIALSLRSGETRFYPVAKSVRIIANDLSPSGLSMSQNGMLLLGGFRGGSQKRAYELHDLKSGTSRILTIDGNNPKLSHDGSLIATQNDATGVDVFNASTSKLVSSIVFPDPIGTFTWSRDGRLGIGTLSGFFAIVPVDMRSVCKLGELKLFGTSMK